MELPLIIIPGNEMKVILLRTNNVRCRMGNVILMNIGLFSFCGAIMFQQGCRTEVQCSDDKLRRVFFEHQPTVDISSPKYPQEVPFSSDPARKNAYLKGFDEGWARGIVPMISITKELPASVAINPTLRSSWSKGFSDGLYAGMEAGRSDENCGGVTSPQSIIEGQQPLETGNGSAAGSD